MKQPVEYSPEIVARICAEIASGKKLIDVCAMEGMPTRAGFYKWMKEHAGVVDMYTRAREERADIFADEIVEIADTEEDPNKARVRIDARKWAAAKLNPKNYGDKIDVSGNLGVTLNDEQLESRVAHLLGKAGIAALARGEGEAEGQT